MTNFWISDGRRHEYFTATLGFSCRPFGHSQHRRRKTVQTTPAVRSDVQIVYSMGEKKKWNWKKQTVEPSSKSTNNKIEEFSGKKMAPNSVGHRITYATAFVRRIRIIYNVLLRRFNSKKKKKRISLECPKCFDIQKYFYLFLHCSRRRNETTRLAHKFYHILWGETTYYNQMDRAYSCCNTLDARHSTLLCKWILLTSCALCCSRHLGDYCVCREYKDTI